MKVTKIKYPTPLSKIKDIENDNIDVFVELENGTTCVVVVSTPKNYYEYMEKENLDFYCGVPDIIVRQITHDNIEKAILKYAEGDAYWLKYYHLAGEISIDVLNKIIEKSDFINL